MSNNNPTTRRTTPEPESFIELGEGFLVGGGRYSLLQCLGQGGMGTVWLAKDERLGQMVALKFVQLQSNPMLLDDLRRETARSLKLTHPNIIRIFDFFEAPGEVAFISMEYVDGANLHSLRAQQQNNVFTWNYLRPIIKQLCEALEYAHGENVIHRDLKPSNMMLDGKGRLKLADFGIAAAMSDPLQAYYQRHAASGTITHMSPQQMAGKPATVADDIYALGATLYDLLTGTTPFNTGDIPTQVQNSIAEPIAIRLGKLKLPNEIPPHVSAMIMACLSKDPEPRPRSVRAVGDWIGLNSPTTVRSGPIQVTIVTDKVGTERKTSRGIILPPSPPASPSAKVSSPELPPGFLPQAPAVSRFPLKKILVWSSASLAAIVFFSSVGWFLGEKVFHLHGGPAITSVPDGSGNLDPTFLGKTTINGFIRCMDIQPDGKILIGGTFDAVDLLEARRLARLNANGTVDPTFVAAANNIVHCIAPLDNGGVAAVGDFSDINGKNAGGIARLTADGTWDSEFKPGSEVNGSVRAVIGQADGKIVVAGNFTELQGVKKNRIARLTRDGSLDESFKGSVNNVIWTMVPQRDRKILIGGEFTLAGTSARVRIARLTRDGDVDSEFSPGYGPNSSVHAIAVQSDGKIILAGDFTVFNTRPRNRVARLDPDGSLDLTFNPGGGPDNGIRALALQNDEKILLGGAFRFFNDTPLSHIARLNVNGTLDESFDPGTGFSDGVRALQVQKDGKILAAGGFTNYNGIPCSRIARLRGTSIKGKK